MLECANSVTGTAYLYYGTGNDKKVKLFRKQPGRLLPNRIVGKNISSGTLPYLKKVVPVLVRPTSAEEIMRRLQDYKIAQKVIVQEQ